MVRVVRLVIGCKLRPVLLYFPSSINVYWSLVKQDRQNLELRTLQLRDSDSRLGWLQHSRAVEKDVCLRCRYLPRTSLSYALVIGRVPAQMP